MAVTRLLSASFRPLLKFLSTHFRPLFIFWATCVVILSLDQALNPTSAHNVGVHIDPLAALMQEFAFQISTLFPSLGKVLLSVFYAALQTLGIVAVFIVLSLIYLPLRFAFWMLSVLYHDVVFAEVKSSVNHADKRKASPGAWTETPENSPKKEEFEDEDGEDKEMPMTPKSIQSEGGSERVDSVLGGDSVSSSRFCGLSPEFRATYTKEE